MPPFCPMTIITFMIRSASTSDAPVIREIYKPYVEETAITFEYEVPSAEEFERRIGKTLSFYPYLVYEEDGVILGYAYASPFKERAAYDWAVETSIYVRKGTTKKGIGRALHDALKEELKRMGILSMYACIAAPSGEDEHLDDNSIGFHSHLGYRLCGRFSKCGYKFGTWYDMVWMELFIGSHEKDVSKPLAWKRIE